MAHALQGSFRDSSLSVSFKLFNLLVHINRLHITSEEGAPFSAMISSSIFKYSGFLPHSAIMPATTMKKQTSLHLLFIPFPAQGHMLAMLDLAGDLAGRGLAITILVTPKNLHLLDPLLSRHPSISTLVIPFPAHPAIPEGVENLKDLPSLYFPDMILALSALHDPLLRWASSSPSRPDAVISDFFLGWTQRLESELQIPRVVFSPSGALAISTLHYLWTELPCQSSAIEFSTIPGSPSIPWYQISSLYRGYHGARDLDWEPIRDGFLRNRRSWGHILNTFRALEGAYLDHLRRDVGHHRVWAVGPLSPASGSAAVDRGGARSVPPEEDVMAWLDRRQCGSVVYVCFGSQVTLSAPQAAAVAAGLERSGAQFLWRVKDGGEVPEGFEERVAGRGLVIRGWAPQVAILFHESVGSFVTHCGWNSVLEAINAGVAMVAWPMGADQFINARLLADEMGAAFRLCERPDPDMVARAVAESLGPTRSLERMKAKAREAVEAGGSSRVDLDAFVAELLKHKLEKEKNILDHT